MQGHRPTRYTVLPTTFWSALPTTQPNQESDPEKIQEAENMRQCKICAGKLGRPLTDLYLICPLCDLWLSDWMPAVHNMNTPNCPVCMKVMLELEDGVECTNEDCFKYGLLFRLDEVRENF
jgi:hypothetical protein